MVVACSSGISVFFLFSVLLLLVFHDVEGTFTGLFFQDAQMRNMYKSFREVVMADVTYKLTDLWMPLFLMIGIDVNSHSQDVAVYLTCTHLAGQGDAQQVAGQLV